MQGGLSPKCLLDEWWEFAFPRSAAGKNYPSHAIEDWRQEVWGRVVVLSLVGYYCLSGCASTGTSRTEQRVLRDLSRGFLTQAQEEVRLMRDYGSVGNRRFGWWSALLEAVPASVTPGPNRERVVECLWERERARGEDGDDEAVGRRQAVADLEGVCAPSDRGPTTNRTGSGDRRPGEPVGAWGE